MGNMNRDLRSPYRLAVNAPNFIKRRPAEFDSHPEMTVLDQGTRVITYDQNGADSVIGFYADAGCMYEDENNAGTSHYVRNMLFRSNLLSSEFNTYKSFQHAGNNYWDGQVGKKFIYIKVECRRDQIQQMMRRMTESFFLPRFAQGEMYKAHEFIENVATTFDHEAMEFVQHQLTHIGFQGTGFANYPDCPLYNVDKFLSQDLVNWWADYFHPKRIQIVGVNISQEELLSAYENSEWAVTNSEGFTHTAQPPAIASSSMGKNNGYLGGEWRELYRNTEKFFQLKHYEDVHIGYGRLGYGRSNLKEFATMLVAAASVQPSAVPMYEHFDGVGVVGGAIRCRPDEGADAARLLASRVNNVGRLSGSDLLAAKKRAAIGLSLAAGSRDGLSDFLAAHSTEGELRSPEDVVAAIGEVTTADLQLASDLMMSAQPTFIVYGGGSDVPSLGSMK